jgi:hypothetical protein
MKSFRISYACVNACHCNLSPHDVSFKPRAAGATRAVPPAARRTERRFDQGGTGGAAAAAGRRRRRLIVNSGDTSDVDGFLALAEYSKV